MFSGGYNSTKLRTNLRLAINRLKLMEKKKTELAQKARKEIADFIAAGKDDRARIRVEHIIREDYLVEAMELVELFCDLLLARYGLIQTMKTVDPGLEEAISSLIWVAPRLVSEIPEIKTVADQLSHKYGKEYTKMTKTNENNTVNDRLIHKMGVQAPPKLLVERYLIEIAKSHSVPYEPDATVLNPGDMEDLLLDYGEESSKSYNAPSNYSKPPGGPGGASNFGGGSSFGGGSNFGGGSGGGNAFAPPPPPQHNPAMAYPPPVQQPMRNAPNDMPGMPSAPHQSPPHPYPGQEPPRYSAINNDSIYTPQAQMPMPPAGPPGAFGGPPGAVGGPPGAVGGPPGIAGPLPPKASPMDSFPELPSVPTSTLPTVNGESHSTGGDQDELDFDDLSKRFEELKKKK